MVEAAVPLARPEVLAVCDLVLEELARQPPPVHALSHVRIPAGGAVLAHFHVPFDAAWTDLRKVVIF